MLTRNLCAISCFLFLSVPLKAELPKQNVVLIMTDGLRWQEVFQGANPEWLPRSQETDITSEADRRQALMPFFWQKIAKDGQILGNRAKGNIVRVTNGRNFSYPGYQEILSGFSDPRIKSNKKVLNPNSNVLDWLCLRKGFGGNAFAIGAWDTISAIVNPRCPHFYVNSGHQTLGAVVPTAGQQLLDAVIKKTPHRWKDERDDAVTFDSALEFMKYTKPRVVFISLGETDELAHAGNYPAYVDAAKNFDSYLQRLWAFLESEEFYSGKTSLVVTTDHGRGSDANTWKSHGAELPDSQYTWLAFLGPKIRALGEVTNEGIIGSNQIAATIAKLLDENYVDSKNKVGKPIKSVFK